MELSDQSVFGGGRLEKNLHFLICKAEDRHWLSEMASVLAEEPPDLLLRELDRPDIEVDCIDEQNAHVIARKTLETSSTCSGKPLIWLRDGEAFAREFSIRSRCDTRSNYYFVADELATNPISSRVRILLLAYSAKSFSKENILRQNRGPYGCGPGSSNPKAEPI